MLDSRIEMLLGWRVINVVEMILLKLGQFSNIQMFRTPIPP